MSPLRKFVLTIGLLTAGVTSFAQPYEPAAADIDAYLQRLEKLGFAGSVVISHNGTPLLARGFGLADRERGIAWSPSTVSTIGSITKQFTGAAILSLAEQGKLAVSDSITNYFEDVPRDKQTITLHQLLTHSSGIVDLAGAGDWDPISRDQFVRRILAQDLAFEPGDGFEYSNAGYSLLGAIIEQLTGVSYEQYLRQRFFLPAGMFETGYILPQWGPQRLAQGYQGSERWGTVLERPLADDGPYWVLRGNGGIHATAWDMLRWAQALLGGRALSPQSMATYWTPHVSEGGDSHYGYGWSVQDVQGSRLITHNGGNGILFADMAIVPEKNLVVVLQTNVVADFSLAQQLLEQFNQRLLGAQPLPDVPERAAQSPGNMNSWSGIYELEGGGRLQVSTGKDELTVEALDRLAFSVLLSTRPVDAARAARLSSEIDRLVTAYLAGDYRPLWEAYRQVVTLEYLQENGRSIMDQLQAEKGALRRHEVLGTAFRDGRDVTLVRLEFEHGEAWRAYVWEPEEEQQLLGISGRGLDHQLHVLPVVGGGYASWDARVGATRPIQFDTSGDSASMELGGASTVRGQRRVD